MQTHYGYYKNLFFKGLAAYKVQHLSDQEIRPWVRNKQANEQHPSSQVSAAALRKERPKIGSTRVFF